MTTMPPLVRRIQEAVENEGDFTQLRRFSEGERAVFDYARAIGLRGDDLVTQWGNVYFRRLQAEKAQVRTAVAATASVPALLSDDLDYWADDAEPDDTDGDDDTVCGACHGSGRDAMGAVCKACGGAGRVAVPADEDEEGEPRDGESEE